MSRSGQKKVGSVWGVGGDTAMSHPSHPYLLVAVSGKCPNFVERSAVPFFERPTHIRNLKELSATCMAHPSTNLLKYPNFGPVSYRSTWAAIGCARIQNRISDWCTFLKADSICVTLIISFIIPSKFHLAPTEQRALRNVNNCLYTNVYSYLETSGGIIYNP